MKFKLLKVLLLIGLAQPVLADLTVPSSLEPFLKSFVIIVMMPIVKKATWI